LAARPPVPQRPLERKGEAAASGDVKVDEGDRVYVAEGDVVAGKYRIERILGVGGVGFVVAARHAELGGHFALKFLKKRFLNDKAIVERFTREARAACRIKSDYVARVYDVGLHGRAPFIVMEHLVGRDLAALLAEHGAFAISDAVEYAVQACAALAVAHTSGIVHRDIKPENLFLVGEEGVATIKLLDFGISKLALASDRAIDEWGPEGEPITGKLICGTPFYMSPEQIRSTATVDARSDIWSLGMVLHELLTATTAFRAETVTDVCRAILDHEPQSICELRPDAPPGLAEVVARCLQKNPAARYANIAELAVALLPFAPPRALAIAEGSAWIRRTAIQMLGSLGSDGRIPIGHGVQAASSHAGLAPRSPAPEPPRSAVATEPGRRPRHRAAGMVGAAIVVVASILAWAAFFALRSHHGDAAKPSIAATPTTATMTQHPVGVAEPPPTQSAAELRSAPTAQSSAWRPAPVASPASPQPVVSVLALPPSRAHAPPVRAQSSVKPALPSPSPPSPTTESTTGSTATTAPVVAPGRPDLGY
jgi:eukaryotic-like serine/threonine-protein kinase